MAVEIPEPLQWVFLLLAGTRWPEADEDQLRDMADHCRKTAQGLQDAAQSADSAVKQALDGQKGTAAEALGTYWDTYTVGEGTPENPGYLPGTVNALNAMGDMLEQVANSAETAKIQIIAQLGILAFQVATAEAEAPFTAGASLAQIPVEVGIVRETVGEILQTLLRETLEMAAKMAAQMGAINLLAQTIEVAEGHRKSIDGKEFGRSVLGGAAGGAAAHLIGKGIGAGGAKIGAKDMVGSVPGKMVTGAAAGVGADVSAQLATTGKVDGDSLLGSGLSGAAGAGLHAGAAGIKGHISPPPAPPAPKLDLHGGSGSGSSGAGAGAGHDGPATFNKSTTSSGGGTYHGPAGTPSGSGGRGRAVTETTNTSPSTPHPSGTGAGGGSKADGLVPFGPGSGHSSAASTPPTPHDRTGQHIQDAPAPRAQTPEPTTKADSAPPRSQPRTVTPPQPRELVPLRQDGPVERHEPAPQPRESVPLRQ
ncbi:hypothetical protein K353_06587, partial [Kitasatospora sp. SolWspMP-SS2h]